VQQDGLFYSIPSPSSDQGRLACLDAAAGTNRWTQTQVGSGNIGFGSVIKSVNALVVLTEAGELVIVKADSTGYLELGRFPVLDYYSWNHVALANGRIYARNTSPTNPEIVAVDVAPSLQPLPDLGLAIERTSAGDKFKLTVRALDGSQLDSAQTDRLELESASDLAAAVLSWSALPFPFSATNGEGVAEVPMDDSAAQFLRAKDKTSGL